MPTQPLSLCVRPRSHPTRRYNEMGHEAEAQLQTTKGPTYAHRPEAVNGPGQCGARSVMIGVGCSALSLNAARLSTLPALTLRASKAPDD